MLYQRMSVAVVLMVLIGLMGCEIFGNTFGDLVPGITSARAEIADTKAVVTDVRSELAGLKDELLELMVTGDAADREAAKAMVDRFDIVEETVAKVEKVVTGVEETLDTTEEEAIKREEEKIDVPALIALGLEYASYAGIPGVGVLGVLWRRANRVTERVVRGVEQSRKENGDMDWDKLGRIHEHAGVGDRVRKIRKKHKRQAEASSLAAGNGVVGVMSEESVVEG